MTQHLLRSRFIVTIWIIAHRKIPTGLNPESYRWIITDAKYIFNWFDDQLLPRTVNDVIGEETVKYILLIYNLFFVCRIALANKMICI